MTWDLSYTLEELPDAWLLSLFSYKEELALHQTPLFKELLYHKIVQSEKKIDIWSIWSYENVSEKFFFKFRLHIKYIVKENEKCTWGNEGIGIKKRSIKKSFSVLE